jgi:hypothetical protein
VKEEKKLAGKSFSPRIQTTSSLKNLDRYVKKIRCKRESPFQVREMQSAFHPRAQRSAFRRGDVRPRRRSFDRENPRLQRSPNSNRLC